MPNIFTKKTSEHLGLGEDYNFEKEENLDSLILELVENKNINSYLKNNLKPGKGVLLGRAYFNEDIHTEILYGLTVDQNETKLFFTHKKAYESKKLNSLEKSFPNYSDKKGFTRWPSYITLKNIVNSIFSQDNLGYYAISIDD